MHFLSIVTQISLQLAGCLFLRIGESYEANKILVGDFLVPNALTKAECVQQTSSSQ